MPKGKKRLLNSSLGKSPLLQARNKRPASKASSTRPPKFISLPKASMYQPTMGTIEFAERPTYVKTTIKRASVKELA